MYIRMMKKHTANLITFIIILFLHIGLYAQNSVIYIGESDLWSNVQLINLSLIEGKRGYLDITNSDNEYQPDKYSDMIFSFNSSTERDKTGNYSIVNSQEYIKSETAFGGAAAFFDGTDPLLISSEDNAMFTPAEVWSDFSLEFRMLPATLKEGSTIFLWKGLQKKENHLIPQEIRCTISNRKLVWDFENLFLNPDNSIERISLAGDKMIPGIWSHHMITFNSQTGLLEYKINNIPADNVYTTKSGFESNEFNIPTIGNQQSFPIELGENYSGLIDEFRISKKVIENPVLKRYSSTGSMETEIIDLIVPNSELISINSDSSLPQNTAIKYQYAISNNKFDLLNQETIWYNFTPSSLLQKKGQFIKIKAQLYSEIAKEIAPVLSNFQLIYKKADAPSPPVDLTVQKDGDKIKLSWKKSINPEILGYLIYYGEEPGQYLSEGSPIDSGNENSIIINGLENKRYYFSITSYKSLIPRLESVFSREISISP